MTGRCGFCYAPLGEQSLCPSRDYGRCIPLSQSQTEAEWLQDRRDNPTCPTRHERNTVWGIATAWFPYCSPQCQDAGRADR
jgi:hypothetical protein